jgi:hypothetical protein
MTYMTNRFMFFRNIFYTQHNIKQHVSVNLRIERSGEKQQWHKANGLCNYSVAEINSYIEMLSLLL